MFFVFVCGTKNDNNNTSTNDGVIKQPSSLWCGVHNNKRKGKNVRTQKKMNTNAQEDVFLCGRVFFLPFQRRRHIEKEERERRRRLRKTLLVILNSEDDL